jgi:predicted PurR-regulated permease PerM
VRIAAITVTVAIVIATAVWAKPVLMPLALAMLLHLALAPLVRALKRVGLPAFVGSFVVVGIAVAAVALIVLQLAEPAQEWIRRMPSAFSRLEARVHTILEPMRGIAKASETVQKIGTEDPANVVKVAVVDSADNTVLIARTGEFVGLASMTMLFVYFLLASDGAFLRRLVRVLPRLSDKKRAVETARRIEHDVSRYFSTFFAISVGLGVCECLAMALVGMPNPVLWGLMAMVLCWIPYAGAIVGTVIVALVASMSFDSAGDTFLAPLVYYCVTVIEGSVVTPLIMGRRLTINPVVALVWVALWGWMWGVVGAFIALPTLAALRIVASKSESGAWLSEILSAGECEVVNAETEAPQAREEVLPRSEHV